MAIDHLVLVAAFVKSANVSELRQALQLPVHLGKLEAEFVRAADHVFEDMGKGNSTGHQVSLGTSPSAGSRASMATFESVSGS